MKRFPTVAAAHVRAAQEYCHCVTAVYPDFGPSSEEQAEQGERLAQLTIDMLRKAIELSPDDTKKVFLQSRFRALEGRARYQEIIAAIENLP